MNDEYKSISTSSKLECVGPSIGDRSIDFNETLEMKNDDTMGKYLLAYLAEKINIPVDSISNHQRPLMNEKGDLVIRGVSCNAKVARLGKHNNDRDGFDSPLKMPIYVCSSWEPRKEPLLVVFLLPEPTIGLISSKSEKVIDNYFEEELKRERMKTRDISTKDLFEKCEILIIGTDQKMYQKFKKQIDSNRKITISISANQKRIRSNTPYVENRLKIGRTNESLKSLFLKEISKCSFQIPNYQFSECTRDLNRLIRKYGCGEVERSLRKIKKRKEEEEEEKKEKK